MTRLPCQEAPRISPAARIPWRARGVVRIVLLSAYLQISSAMALTDSHMRSAQCVARGLRASDRLRVDKRTRLKAAEIS